MARYLSRVEALDSSRSRLDLSSHCLYALPMSGESNEKPKRRHNAQINFRLTPEHDHLIREAAEHSGQTLTNWIRGVLVREARRELGH